MLGCLEHLSTRGVGFQERGIDRKRCLHSLSRRRDDELHAAAGVACGVNTRHASRRIFVTVDARIVFAEFTAELRGQMRPLMLSRREKESRTGDLCAVAELDTFEFAARAFEASYWGIDDANTVTFRLIEHG